MPVLIHLRKPKHLRGKLCDFIYGEEDFPTGESAFYEVGYKERMLVPKDDIELIERHVLYPKDDSNVCVLS